MAIEAPDYTLPGSLERVAVADVDDLQVHVIGIEGLIMNRLRGCARRRSTCDGEWAGRLIALHEASIDWEYLNGQAEKEGLLESLESLEALESMSRIGMASSVPDGEGLSSWPVSWATPGRLVCGGGAL